MNDKKNKPKIKREMIAREDYLRVAADLENFKKDQIKVQEQMAKFASFAVVTKMIDVLELLDQAIESAPGTVKGDEKWFAGLESVRKEFEGTLAKAGAEHIETAGKTFDPATMEAVGTANGGQADTVQSEQRAGWTMHGRVIRPARVIVFQ